MSSSKAIQLVDADDLEEYPIATDQRLESHFYVEMHFRRWLNSRFCLLAEPEVGFYGFNLFFVSQDQSPVGTLPVDDRLLAKYLNIDIERWRGLCKREISPLYNWSKVRCSNGEIRWAHPVVTEMALKALGSKRKNAEAKAKARERKRLKDLTQMLERIGAKRLVANAGFVELLDAWLIEHRPECNRTEPVIREALNVIGSERP